MGSLIRDVDGDGRLDWLVTGIAYPTRDGDCPSVGLFAGCSGNRVYLNRGRMRFEDGTDELGLRNSGWAWGVAAADFGNDGRLQVVITNGRTGPGTVDPDDQVDVYYYAFTRDHTRFFIRARGDDGVVDAADQVGIHDDAVSHAVVVLDHDRDGRLDLLIANAGAAPYLYRNVSTPRRHWVGIVLSDPDNPGNPAGIGSRVEVTTSRGTVTQVVQTSGSYEAQHPAELHVGLGAGRATRVRVWWPGQGHPQVVTGPPTDRLITITREP